MASGHLSPPEVGLPATKTGQNDKRGVNAKGRVFTFLFDVDWAGFCRPTRLRWPPAEQKFKLVSG